MANGAHWELVRLLPNLRLPPSADAFWTDPNHGDARETLTLGSPWLAIVPGDDPRLIAFADRHPVTHRLLSSFRNIYAMAVAPAALIAQENAPIPRRMDAIAAFRNAVAMSIVLRARAAGLVQHHGGAANGWSDLFDFHPAEVDTMGQIQIRSAAVFHFVGAPDELSFSPSPFIDAELDIRFADRKLRRALSEAWRTAYLRARRRNILRPVFRSLELAYQASSLPLKNVGSLYDFGLSIAQWISALETLLWPVNRAASQPKSVAYLAGIRWDDPRLNARRLTVTYGKKPNRQTKVRVHFIQKVCALIYEARNNFLHGEPFTKRHLEPWSERQTNLVSLAAIVYRQALLHRLNHLFPPQPSSSPADIAAELVDNIFTDDILEKAMLLASGVDPDQ